MFYKPRRWRHWQVQRFSEAVDAVLGLYPTLTDTQVQRVVLTALGASPTREAFDFLCGVLRAAPLPEATWALDALAPKLYGDAAEVVKQCLRTRQNDDLLQRFQRLQLET